MEWLKKLLGYKYLLNVNSGEVHYLPVKGKRCGYVDPRNRKLISEHQFKLLRGSWYKGNLVNGCRWCNKNFDVR